MFTQPCAPYSSSDSPNFKSKTRQLLTLFDFLVARSSHHHVYLNFNFHATLNCNLRNLQLRRFNVRKVFATTLPP